MWLFFLYFFFCILGKCWNASKIQCRCNCGFNYTSTGCVLAKTVRTFSSSLLQIWAASHEKSWFTWLFGVFKCHIKVFYSIEKVSVSFEYKHIFIYMKFIHNKFLLLWFANKGSNTASYNTFFSHSLPVLWLIWQCWQILGGTLLVTSRRQANGRSYRAPHFSHFSWKLLPCSSEILSRGTPDNLCRLSVFCKGNNQNN